MGDFARIRVYISIHAPREGSDDVLILGGSRCIDDFNPRSPRGERLKAAKETELDALFQSTLPARGATDRYPLNGVAHFISIHAPREGSDHL